MSGFNANVPARKPRTLAGRVLNELTADPQEATTENGTPALALETPAAMETSSASTIDAAAHTSASQPGALLRVAPAQPAPPQQAPAQAQPTYAQPQPAPQPIAVQQPANALLAHAHPQGVVPQPQPVAPQPAPHHPLDFSSVLAGPPERQSRLAVGYDRIRSLRERLSASTRPRTAATEPKRTAAHVLEVVGEMRARLDHAIQERSEMAWALDEARHVLARVEADLEKERKARAAVELQAEERARIADEAVSEAEALAAERDLVLAELAEQRRLDDEQAALLLEAEQVLALRDVASESAAKELAEVREIVDSQSMEIAELKGALEAAALDRGRIEARCRELEAELVRLAEATEALETLEATVIRRG
jgi:hypothetical protein